MVSRSRYRSVSTVKSTPRAASSAASTSVVLVTVCRACHCRTVSATTITCCPSLVAKSTPKLP